MAGSPKAPSSTMERSGMTAAEAERFVATAWCVLEEHELATPVVAARQSGVLLDISLSFSTAADCAVVEKRFLEVL